MRGLTLMVATAMMLMMTMLMMMMNCDSCCLTVPIDHPPDRSASGKPNKSTQKKEKLLNKSLRAA